MTPEGKVKEKIKAYLKEVGAWYYMPVQNGMGVVGIPDLVCCYKGYFVGIETKAPKKKPTTKAQRWKKATANQQRRLTEIRDAGGYAIVADDLQQAKDLIEEIDNATQRT